MTRPALADPQLVYTPAEVAGALRISKSKIYELLASQEIDCIRIGSLLRVPHDALVRYIANLTESRNV